MVMIMNKILVRLYVPMLDQQYDVKLPLNKTIDRVIDLLVKAVGEFSDDYYKPKKRPILYDKLTAEPYNINLKVKNSGIRNSSEIILM